MSEENENKDLPEWSDIVHWPEGAAVQFSEEDSAFKFPYPKMSAAPLGAGIILSNMGYSIQLMPGGMFILDGVLVNPGDEQRGTLVYESFIRLLKGEDFDAHLRVKELEAECQRLRDAISEIKPPPVGFYFSEREELVSKIVCLKTDIEHDREQLETTAEAQNTFLLTLERELEEDEAMLRQLEEELKRLDEET